MGCSMKSTLEIANRFLVLLAFASLSSVQASDRNIVGPPGSVAFGTHAVVLPNGNIVVTDPKGSVASIGVVYLYSPDGTLISSLTGGSNGDSVGSGGIQILANGNFLIKSPLWRNSTSNAAKAGAVTWVNAVTGLSGAVFDGNSLVGTSADDRVGQSEVVLLSTGHYVVPVPQWDNAAVADAGAVVWGNGNVGISGPVTTSNALFGITSSDQVGKSVMRLVNDNYVACSPFWDNVGQPNAGAATWANGAVGMVGAVSAANSLIGASTEDNVCSRGITALNNGNYVVSSHTWSNASQALAGAATWADGSTGLVGVVSSANSLVGASFGDVVGDGGVIALANGNYVVSSPRWANGTHLKAGAATWGSGSTGVSGTISAGNSLVGLGSEDGTPPSTSGYVPAVALSNGNYVVVNPGWDNGTIADVGAVTWGNGASGRAGVISASNSLIGLNADDAVGSAPTTVLPNGNYVVGSHRWHKGAAAFVGAATWANGASGLVGVVSAANSLVGSKANDNVGRRIHALENGNYVIASPSWDDGTIVDAGAVTWRSGTTASGGPVSRSNSLVGGAAGDAYGTALLVLANGDFVAGSDGWDHGGIANTGAFTRVDGSRGFVGRALAGNSILGSIVDDNVGSGARTKLGENYYAIISDHWDNGGIVDAGAVTILRNSAASQGLLSTANSVLGAAIGAGFRLFVGYDQVLDRAVIGRPADNTVTLRDLALFADGFD